MSLAGIFGFLIPDILLTNKIQKRAELIQGALPDAVEMLTMCVESGLSFQQSLQRVSENQKNVISTEFARVMSEIQIGTPRVLALENMGERLNHPDVSKFVNSMLQVDRLGIPISSVLGEQISDLRTRARMRAREKAMKVPVKILGPVMVCFMPCTLIIVLGPVILSFVS
jgi:tight adherence protein C